jgi:hypothetical protein
MSATGAADFFLAINQRLQINDSRTIRAGARASDWIFKSPSLCLATQDLIAQSSN